GSYGTWCDIAYRGLLADYREIFRTHSKTEPVLSRANRTDFS
ncbi:unnamed protein product, partial [marine sediment metagenome]